MGVTGHKLYRGTAPGVYGAPTTLGNVTSYTDANAVTGTRYYYAVAAVDAAGNEGAKSPEATAVAVDNTLPADTTPPTAPASLAAADKPADTGGAINLSWTAATDAVGVTGYRVYRGTATGVYGAPTTLGNVTTYTDATATTGTRYYYVVRAFDAAGNLGAASPEASAIAVDNSRGTSRHRHADRI